LSSVSESAWNARHIDEKTEVLYDPNEIVRRVIELCYTVKYTMDGCIDVNGPSMFVDTIPVTKAFADTKNRGVKIRFISEISKDNLKYCKELMKIAEVRHLDDVKGNFGVSDGSEYDGGADTIKSGPPPQFIISTVKSFVKQQQYFFDMLWNKAIPAKQRIKEIEQGTKREFMDTLQDPYETQKILVNLLKSATEEILIILPTTTNNRFYEYEHEYMLQLLKNAVTHAVKIRILLNESAKKRLERELSTSNSDLVELQVLDKQQQNKVMTIILDKELCLSVEVKDNDDEDYGSSVEVLGLATHSNSESTVSSYASIFETLWIQAELNNKKKIYQL
jgi:two-component system, OmpR family, sensor histidine kinase VicK